MQGAKPRLLAKQKAAQLNRLRNSFHAWWTRWKFVVLPIAGYKLVYDVSRHGYSENIKPHAGHGHSPFSLRTTSATPIIAVAAAPHNACVVTAGIIMAAASNAADAAWHKPERYFKSSFFIRASIKDIIIFVHIVHRRRETLAKAKKKGAHGAPCWLQMATHSKQ